MKLSILVLEGCMNSAVAGVADLLTLTNHVMHLRGNKVRFSWQTLSLDGKPVRMGGGLTFPVDGATESAVPATPSWCPETSSITRR